MENEKKIPERPDERTLTGSPEAPDTAGVEAKVEKTSAPEAEVPRKEEGRLPRPKGTMLTIEQITAICIVLTLIISSLITAWYQEKTGETDSSSPPAGTVVNREGVEYVNIKVFYPSPKGLVPEDREVEKSDLKRFMLEAAVNEYFKGPSGDVPSYVPEGTRLLAIFSGQ